MRKLRPAAAADLQNRSPGSSANGLPTAGAVSQILGTPGKGKRQLGLNGLGRLFGAEVKHQRPVG